MRSVGCIWLATKDAVKSVGALVLIALWHSNGIANAIEDKCECTVKVTKESGHELSTAVCVSLNWETDLAAAPVVNFLVPLMLEMNYGAEVVVCKCWPSSNTALPDELDTDLAKVCACTGPLTRLVGATAHEHDWVGTVVSEHTFKDTLTAAAGGSPGDGEH